MLELSHDLDYLCWILGRPRSVSAWVGRVSDLEIDVEDSAFVLSEFELGDRQVCATVHLDFVRRDTVRVCEFVCEEGTLRWDAVADSLTLARDGRVDTLVQRDANGPDTYARELRHFVRSMQEATPVLIPLSEGRMTLDVVEAVREAAEQRSWVSV